MTDDQHGEGGPDRGAQGSWERLPGEYDDGATAFVQLPEGGIDALLAADSPLAAPGHSYVPPSFTPAAGTPVDQAAAGSWDTPAEGVQWPDPAAGPDQGAGDRFTYHPGTAGPWHYAGYERYEEPAAPQEAPAPGRDVTGEWSIPVAGGDLPDESGEFSTSSLVEQWGGTPPTTLPGGAAAPWAASTVGQPWPDAAETPGDLPAEVPGEPSDALYEDGAAHGGVPGGPEAPEAAQEASGPVEMPDGVPGQGFSQGMGHDPAQTRRQDHAQGHEPAPAAQGGYDPAPAGQQGFAQGVHQEAAPLPPHDGARPGHDPAAAHAQGLAQGVHHDVVPARPQDGHEPMPAPQQGFAQGARHEPRPAQPQDGAQAHEHASAPQPEPALLAGSESMAAPGPAPVAVSEAPTAPGQPAAEPAAEAADAPDPEPGPEHEPGAASPHDDHPLASYVLRVNGADRPVTDAWIGESLLYVLRERLGLAGAKDGCSQGECGACNVQVDGRLVASCLVPAATAASSEVRTVEGLAADGQPSDVQRALARCGAVQCGFCVPGIAMTLHDLLEGNPAPTTLETRQALCGNLCRCSGYQSVIEAVKEVVAEREAHAEAEVALDAEEARIPHQAGPGSGGVHPSAFDDAPPNEHPYGQDGGQA
ncbi:2Fe-2S iron-sulfur cluster-binding protein [Streptomyces nodosus]|uniref:2Fe-2S iron-sulfur cluster-binding protein n=1 Tax=Streptomyces nodosus TaxID=40318 RepID=UPI003454DF76